MVGAEVGETVADLVEAFDYVGGDHVAGVEVGEGGAGVGGWGEVVGVGELETAEEVELSVGFCYGCGVSFII